ncbi:hypothetical protein Bhyg_01145 [Pseudolycoriella hygida]|uniref:Uncharacterized protein n=1 Tax=Pseudolycoriella hygida TaxID=35572 RepID=A0A9Q0NAB0_9DIPT|nr:hypothetical protein Bhyg_01145 [Pseudolycoriella hygida]
MKVTSKTSNFSKFRLLMWKNLLLQWRHKLRTLVEILAPVLFSALLVVIRSLVDPRLYPCPTRFPSFPLGNLDNFR